MNNTKNNLTLKNINNYLKSQNITERLAKGKGYYYFYNGNASN
jgi:hypothetical protein